MANIGRFHVTRGWTWAAGSLRNPTAWTPRRAALSIPPWHRAGWPACCPAELPPCAVAVQTPVQSPYFFSLFCFRIPIDPTSWATSTHKLTAFKHPYHHLEGPPVGIVGVWAVHPFITPPQSLWRTGSRTPPRDVVRIPTHMAKN